ncbi:NAD(P)H-hydrate dehydratase [Frigidibacter sp. ROC022]|uniref:NAD(P)H-hydrate dehydratase n=1 Tax=Frigidibacter sp. ROC022 TaxID=2971796 RepID=UPI00215AD0AD|nr:NAD(P)H-hydrate dehydratase [Frigidibacter sp. ROC022]MCR8725693.1 NAD(P)H-hydrate dehydratase [Frigidibacter sp. ROC022]
MTDLLTAAQMRAIERAAMDSGAVTGLELMERAGRGVVAALLEEWPELAVTVHRAVVLCGPGNNGGDGFVVARLLAERGWEVELFHYGDADRLPPDARVNHARWQAIGTTRPLEGDAVRTACEAADLVVDALFGIGLTRPLEPALKGALPLAPCRRSLAIDVPSGLDADSGRPLSGTLPADLTVTFERPKRGHHLGQGPRLCGSLRVVPLGLDPQLILSIAGEEGRELLPADVVAMPRGAPKLVDGSRMGVPPARWFPKGSADAGRGGGDHKYAHGHALILSGPASRGGAARLAARGALRIGAGVVTLGAPGPALAENAARLDAIMLRQVDGAADLAGLLADRRINALCLGPALGLDARAGALIGAALRAEHAPGVVLDADALSLLGQDDALFGALSGRCILTPHAGEFARLFPDIAETLAAPVVAGPAFSKVDATREAAARAGCVVLFKGADTVIADPWGRCAVHSAAYDRAAPWLATAGSGDVLAGMICGLLARGLDPMLAAATAAWLHVEAARFFGPGLIAEDLPEELPKVFRALGM